MLNNESNRQFGQYTLLEKLGVGGMATVYRAIHDKSGYEVAIKVLHEHFADDNVAVKRLEREAKITQQLQHPNIVPIITFNKAEARPYLVMPYYAGGTLAQYFSRPREMQHETILKVLRVLGDGLDYAHEKGIVHRDFKLENILLNQHNTPAISDFGIAQLANTTKLTATGRFLGTPHYMAPEQSSAAQDVVDHRADLYAFAVMAYLLLTGVFPFTAADPIQLIVKHNTQIAPTPSLINQQLSSNVDAVLLRGMAKHPLDRYASATLFVKELEHAFNNLAPVTTLIDMERPNPLGNSQPISFAAITRKSDDENSTLVFEEAAPIVEKTIQLEEVQQVPLEKRKKRRLIPLLMIFLAACGISSYLFFSTGGNNFMNSLLLNDAELTEAVAEETATLADINIVNSSNELEATSSTEDSSATSVTETIEATATSRTGTVAATATHTTQASRTSRPTNATSTSSATNTARPTNTTRPTNTIRPTNTTRPTNTNVPNTSIPPTAVPPTSVPPTSVPPTNVPPTSVPPTSVPPTNVPPTSVPPTNVPPPPPTNPPTILDPVNTLVPILPTVCLPLVGCT